MGVLQIGRAQLCMILGKKCDLVNNYEYKIFHKFASNMKYSECYNIQGIETYGYGVDSFWCKNLIYLKIFH